MMMMQHQHSFRIFHAIAFVARFVLAAVNLVNLFCVACLFFRASSIYLFGRPFRVRRDDRSTGFIHDCALGFRNEPHPLFQDTRQQI
ncbi:MAG: hypothetical protein LBO00_10175 [Zoogloeaceae bacterium]|nr:hypothetical protein [Zoogloeaceae bacterium]